MASKTGEKGLLIVHTGTGKGKTSAALGMVFRHIGHGYPVGVVQFTKSPSWDTGEARVLAKFPDLVTLHIMGEGFTWETQDRARDIAAATAGWERAKELIRDDRHRMVLLDELNIVLRYEYLPIEDVYRCPAGEKLTYRYTNEEDGRTLRHYWTTACRHCPLKSQCAKANERRIKRWVMSTCSKPCSSVSIKTRRRCVNGARQLSIRSRR